jgi:hypothetical protein
MITGCSDFLDKQPDDMKTDEMIWKSSAETEAYLYNVYSQVPLWGANVDPWLGLSDECDMSWNVYPTYSVNLGNWNPSTGLYNMWQPFYKAIRASFVFENNVDKCPELSDRLKRQYKAEVKFLRGFYYWQILKQYGPAVLITEQLPNGYDWNHFPRTPFDDCVAYICQMLDEAYPDLPLNWKSDRQWFGKADRTACLAIKSEVLLLAASEQWNGNPYYRNFVNPDGTPLAGRVYNESKWRKAADAAKEVIAIAETDPKADIRLYKNHENGDGTVFSPYKSVRDVLLMKWNCEILFGRQVFNYDSWEVHCSPGTYNLGGQAPTQRLVDAFYMKNGRIISDPLSGYVEEGFAATAGESWNPRNLNPVTDRIEMIRDIRNGDAWGHWAGDWNMYANREPRFYAAILYNKRIVPQFAEDVAKRDYFSSPGQKNGYARVELYYGGFSRGSGASTFYPRTGYLVLKNCDPQSNMCQGDRVYVKTQRQQTYIRYGGILLNYIEALNECDPNNADIEKYWNMIRERAGIPNIFAVYPDIKGNKLKQRELILRERQIELCFEFDRYFTTRRRWLANTPDDGSPTRQWGEGGKMWGMDINAGNASTNDFNFTGFYRRVAFEERVFSEKMCLFPIAQSELDKNNMMVQNPGW